MELLPLSFAVEKQGQYFSISCQSILKQSGLTPCQKRGKVSSFSKKSRKRLLELFAKLKKQRALFITLTIPKNLRQADDALAAKAALRALYKRLERRSASNGVEPRAAWIWRLERQKNGAIHFHIVAYGSGFVDHRLIKIEWASVLGLIPQQERASALASLAALARQGDTKTPIRLSAYVRTEVRAVSAYRQAISYVSKYIAKVDNRGDISKSKVARRRAKARLKRVTSRKRARSRTKRYLKRYGRALRHAPGRAVRRAKAYRRMGVQRVRRLYSFISMPYLAAPRPREDGRLWGVLGKEHLPFAPLTQFRVSDFSLHAKQFYDIRRTIAKAFHLRIIKRRHAGACVLFSSRRCQVSLELAIRTLNQENPQAAFLLSSIPV